MRRLPLVAATAGILSVSGGCATTSRVASPRGEEAAAPAQQPARPDPNYRYSTGRGQQEFQSPSAAVEEAAVEAMEDLSITVVRRGHEGPVSQIEGRTPDNRTITVTLRPQKPITRVSCRVGWFGDEPFSRTLLHRIGVRLGVFPPEAIPDKIPSAPASNPYFSRNAVSDEEMMRDFLEAPYRSRPDM